MSSETKRTVAFQVRRKGTKDGQAEEKTKVLIWSENSKENRLELKNAGEEMDFLEGTFPVEWREITDEEGEEWKELYPARHIKKKKASKDEEEGGEKIFIPVRYEGLLPDDEVVILFGGWGDAFAFRASFLGNKVYRIATFTFTAQLGKGYEDQVGGLMSLFKKQPELFYEITAKDRALLSVSVCRKNHKQLQQLRIALWNQLLRAGEENVFYNDQQVVGLTPIEETIEKIRQDDVAYKAIEASETAKYKKLEKEVKSLDVWEKIFGPITGCGPVITGDLVGTIGDIRRFSSADALVSFCGVGALADGTQPRRKRGVVCNWNPKARQALFQLADQFNRRPNTPWGQELLAFKVKLTEEHPEVIEENGKKRYTKGHIHKMAIWKTLRKFVRWLYAEWNKVDALARIE